MLNMMQRAGKMALRQLETWRPLEGGYWGEGAAARRQRGAGSRWGDCLRALTGALAVLWRSCGRRGWDSWRLCLGR
jgi:hypothetical protein